MTPSAMRGPCTQTLWQRNSEWYSLEEVVPVVEPEGPLLNERADPLAKGALILLRRPHGGTPEEVTHLQRDHGEELTPRVYGPGRVVRIPKPEGVGRV